MKAEREKQLIELQNFLTKDQSYFAHGQREFNLLGINIEGVGKVPFPLIDSTAQQIINLAQKAPYGKGHDTIVDTSVRNTWEIEPSLVSFSNKNIDKHLQYILGSIQEQLDIEDYVIEANFYKVLLYEKGSFFIKHKDSEKEKGMFGTLVVTLPSSYEGGEFVIEFDGKSETILHKKKDECINWIAFYADCDHEILPITEGYRIALVYNLVSKEQKPRPFVNSLGLQKAMEILQEKEFQKMDKPIALFLSHQYTEENFRLDLLKGADKTCANILLEACNQLGWYANIGLLEHVINGMPDGGYYDDDVDAETAEMGEVYFEEDNIVEWILKPSLGDINLEILEEINKMDYENAEPIEKEAEGYMGNYGPDLNFTYRNSIFVMAPPNILPQLLSKVGFRQQLEWLNYYMNSNYIDIVKAKNIYSQLNWENAKTCNANFDGVIALWTYNTDLFLNDKQSNNKFILALCNCDINGAVGFITKLSNFTVLSIFNDGFKSKNDKEIYKLYKLSLQLILTNEVFFNELNLMSLLLKNYKDHQILSSEYECNILIALLEMYSIQEFDFNNITVRNEQKSNRDWIYSVLLPLVKTKNDKNKLLADFKNTARQYFIKATKNEPQLPSDYVRDFPTLNTMDEFENILKTFCESSEMSILEFKRKEQDRKMMDHKIDNYHLDIDTYTIKSKSPFTLVLTKNTNSYKRKLKEYKQDLKTLESLNEIG